jgi:hypothetical protein
MDAVKKAAIVSYLMSEGSNISRCARDGWECANSIMNYYDSVCIETCQCRDREWDLLEKSIDEYKRRKGGLVNENII